MVVVIDNYDSFTYNLVQYLGELGRDVTVFRNDAIGIGEVVNLAPEALVISPGPGRPEDAGISIPLVREVAGCFPILGVCLGHQAIGVACGGRVVAAPVLMHGKTSPVHHDGGTLFREIPDPFAATRYHSLVLDRETIPASLEISAWTADGTIMGVRHREHPLEGVQFHPESILTGEGRRMLANFLETYR